jgi:hypothetical protein
MTILRRGLLSALLALAALQAHATTICNHCGPSDTAGTYLGVLNAATGDDATFFHDGIGASLFIDFWVFDIVGEATNAGVAAASFTVDTFLRLFRAQLWTDDGSQCAAGIGCLNVELGDLIDEDFQVNRAVEIDFDLAPGRYILRLSGGTVPPRLGGYTGIVALLPEPVREAGTFGLALLGLLSLGVVTTRGRWNKKP